MSGTGGHLPDSSGNGGAAWVDGSHQHNRATRSQLRHRDHTLDIGSGGAAWGSHHVPAYGHDTISHQRPRNHSLDTGSLDDAALAFAESTFGHHHFSEADLWANEVLDDGGSHAESGHYASGFHDTVHAPLDAALRVGQQPAPAAQWHAAYASSAGRDSAPAARAAATSQAGSYVAVPTQQLAQHAASSAVAPGSVTVSTSAPHNAPTAAAASVAPTPATTRSEASVAVNTRTYSADLPSWRPRSASDATALAAALRDAEAEYAPQRQAVGFTGATNASLAHRPQPPQPGSSRRSAREGGKASVRNANLAAYAGPFSLVEFWDGVESKVASQGIDGRASLPLNRIKTIMKLDDTMACHIGKEYLRLLAKACEVFVEELTWRAWQVVRQHKRNTLLQNDISGATSRDEMYDFLIDIVPQPLMKPSKLREHEQVQRVWFMKEMERQAEEAQRRREVAERLREAGGDVTSTQGGLDLSSLRGTAPEDQAPVEQGLQSGNGLANWREHQRALALLQAQATGRTHVPRAAPQGRVPVQAVLNGAQHPLGAHATAMPGGRRSGGAGADAAAPAPHVTPGRGDGTPRHASRSMGHYV